MRPRRCLRAILLSAAALGAGVVAGPSEYGISSVEAKPYYTRKRVNGEWITGRFAKRHAPARRKALAGPARIRNVTSTAALGTPLRAEAAPAPALETRQAAANPSPAPAASEAAKSPSDALTADGRLLKLQEALQARANSLSEGGKAAAPSPLPPSSVQPLPAAPADLVDARAAPSLREPRSVSLDFKTGIKTTFFTDGASVEERFDVSSLKGLASPPPERAASNAAAPANQRP